MSGIEDLALHAKIIVEDEGRDKITYEDLERAIKDHLAPSDTVFAEGMAEAARKLGKGSRRNNLRAIAAPLSGDATAVQGSGTDDEDTFIDRKSGAAAALSASRSRRSLAAA